MNMRTKRLFCFSAALLLALSASAFGQVSKKAQVGFRFLENPVSAEVVGRGSTGVTTTLNANGVFWNPALIGWTRGNIDVALNRTQGIADINYNAVAAAVNAWDFAVVGVSFLSMDYGTFYGTRLSGNAQGYEETGEFSPKAYAIGLAFSQKISERFSYGVHVKYASQDLGGAYVGPYGQQITDPGLVISRVKYNQGDFALDVGAYYDFLYNGIRFGAVLQNISRELKYENEAFPMPFAVSFGLTIEPLQFVMEGKEARSLLLMIESRHPRDYQEKLKIGAEYDIMDVLTARVGYQNNYDERGLTAGIGVHPVISGFPIRADYAYEAFGVFGAVHHFSLGFTY